MKPNNSLAIKPQDRYTILDQPSKLVRFIEIVILFVILLCLWAQYAFIGNILNARNVNYIDLITIPLDHALPFSTTWSLFYSIALFVPFLFGWIILIRTQFNFLFTYRLLLTSFLILLIHYCIYFIFPTCKTLWQEPGFTAFWQQIQNPGLLNENTRFVLSITTPWNSFPSFHIGSAWIILRYTFERFKILGSLFLVWFIGMCLGTITLKVHVIMDGVVAIILSELCYQLFKANTIQMYLKKFIAISPRRFILIFYFFCALIAAPLVLYELTHIKLINVNHWVIGS